MYKPLKYKDLDLSDKYLISEDGLIINKKTNKPLKTWINSKGYEQVCVSLGSRNKKKTIRIHIAVAYNFIDGYNDGYTVNHKDGNKINNNYKNLEWTSNRDNIIHAHKNNLCTTDIKVMCNETKEVFPSIQKAMKWCGLSEKGGSMYEYFNSNKRKTAGRHPVTKEKLTWTIVK